MAAIQYPEFIARFYDVIYHQIRDEVDTRFFLHEIASVKGRCLEIGVGTGRFFTEALKCGADIYGIDSSKCMTDQLLRKIPSSEHHRIKTGDAADMKWDFKFDLIIAPFRVLSHMLNVEDQLKLLNNVHNHLSAKGKFIFDVFVPDPNLLANGMHDKIDFEGEYQPGQKIQRIVSSKPDIVNQLLNVTMRISWDENGLRNEKVFDFDMRFFFRYELEHLIRLSSLRIDIFYGDYNYSPLDKGSKDFVIVCRR
jgi:SAM-dependent methyltransferase